MRSASRGVAGDVIRVPVRVPHLPDRPATHRRRGEHRRRLPRIDDDGLVARGIVEQPDVIVVEHRHRDELERAAHHISLRFIRPAR
jgi:hypothetical protein